MFKSKDGADILISIQNDREWRVLADKVLGDAKLADDPRFATNRDRVMNRAETDALIGGVFARYDVAPLMALLETADIAFARVSDCGLLSAHPHLRRITVDSPNGPVSFPAPGALFAGETRRYGAVPGLNPLTA